MFYQKYKQYLFLCELTHFIKHKLSFKKQKKDVYV